MTGHFVFHERKVRVKNDSVPRSYFTYWVGELQSRIRFKYPKYSEPELEAE